MGNYFRFLLFLGGATCCLLIACREEIVPDPYQPGIGHDRYTHALENVGLKRSALGREWIRTATHALHHPVQINSPYQESFFMDPSNAASVGYRFHVKRGQKIEVSIIPAEDSMQLFIDLFRVNNDSFLDFQHVASADSASHKLGFEPRRDADYILRIQPELLQGGEFQISIRQVPALGFPVSGKTSKAIGSFFGDARDGGKREHHGVDIFARRHTPVLAPSKSYVRNVSVRGLGGKVVWLYDSKRRISMYFAHLDSQMVRPHTFVEPGDTIGLVGNTGNARHTPSHLHFGIYSHGPIDPYYFLKETRTAFDELNVPSETVGSWMRVRKETLLADRLTKGIVVDTLAPFEVIRIIGAASSKYRIRRPDGKEGFVNARTLESLDTPIEAYSVEMDTPILEGSGKWTIGEVASGDSLKILGGSAHFKMVITPAGEHGWISVD